MRYDSILGVGKGDCVIYMLRLALSLSLSPSTTNINPLYQYAYYVFDWNADSDLNLINQIVILTFARQQKYVIKGVTSGKISLGMDGKRETNIIAELFAWDAIKTILSFLVLYISNDFQSQDPFLWIERWRKKRKKNDKALNPLKGNKDARNM